MNIQLYDYNMSNYYNGWGQNYMALKLIGVVDDFISCVFTRSYSGIGGWQIVLENNSPNVARMRQARFIKLYSGVCGLINQTATVISNDDNTTTFTGVELKGLTQLKIIDRYGDNGAIWRGSSYFKNVSQGIIMKNYIFYGIYDRNSQDRIQCAIDKQYQSITTTGTTQPTYGNLADQMVSFASSAELGWYADIDTIAYEDIVYPLFFPGQNTPVWDSTIPMIVWNAAYKGKDRTSSQSTNNRFIIDYELDRITSSTLEEVKYLPNCALVAGQGEGSGRVRYYVGGNTKYGLDHIETYVDARDLETQADLIARGNEILAEYGTNQVYNCEASETLIADYHTGWDLGDLGTLIDSKLGVSFDFRLNEITEVYEKNVFRLELTFGVDGNNLTSVLQQISSGNTGLINSEDSGGGGGNTDDCVHIYDNETAAGNKTWTGTATFTANPIIKGELYPNFELHPTSNGSEGNCRTRYEGSYYGASSIQSWEDSTGDNRRLIQVNTKSKNNSLSEAVQLRVCDNQVWHDYNILHTGSIWDIIYPIGTIYETTSSTFNPNNAFGGQWEQFGEGKVLIGAGTGYDSNGNSMTFTGGATGGEYTHTLTESEMPSHTHTQAEHKHGYNTGGKTVAKGSNYNRPSNTSTYSSGLTYQSTPAQPEIYATGGGQAHNNLQPYIVVYRWVRVANSIS